MLKPVFDFTADQCGQPNPLLVLSRNLGQTGSQVTSGTERVSSVQQLVALQKAPSDLLVQEYLANVAQNTGPPSTFDMRQMLAQLPANDQRQIGKVLMEQSWTEAQAGSKTAEIATNWTRNFLVAPQSGLATEWNEEFTKERNGAQMEGAWQAARSGSNSTWAKDFLEHYDLSGAQNSNHQHDWEKEFLEHMNKLGIHQDQQHESPFFDYETAWEAIHSKETQENYVFAQGNPYLHEENPLESAQQSFSQGLLADSILQYEAALQREPNNSEIWYSLGIALAENEQDPHAISALRKTLKLNPHSEKAILALAVSLANESFEHLALHELHKWICIHQARELPADNSQNTSLFHQYMPLDRTEFGKVERQFLESARAVQQVDSELQNALSILYNLGRDYDRAVDCLHAALSLKPEDPVLWNRLGATLANADRTAEAINAYKRSLQISPFYVRARYNLGIACMNLNSYREAAAHFVAALQTQHSPDNSHIWSQLRSSLIRFDNSHLLGHELFDALDRRDLAPILNFLQLQG